MADVVRLRKEAGIDLVNDGELTPHDGLGVRFRLLVVLCGASARRR